MTMLATKYKSTLFEIVKEVKSKARFKNDLVLKRRVYDALNVLSALDIIEKNGRVVNLKQHLTRLKLNHEHQEMSQLKLKIEKATQRKAEKQNEL